MSDRNATTIAISTTSSPLFDMEEIMYLRCNHTGLLIPFCFLWIFYMQRAVESALCAIPVALALTLDLVFFYILNGWTGYWTTSSQTDPHRLNMWTFIRPTLLASINFSPWVLVLRHLNSEDCLLVWQRHLVGSLAVLALDVVLLILAFAVYGFITFVARVQGSTQGLDVD